MATEIPLGFDGVTSDSAGGTTSTSPADFTVQFTPAVDPEIADVAETPATKEDAKLLNVGKRNGSQSPTEEEKVRGEITRMCLLAYIATSKEKNFGCGTDFVGGGLLAVCFIHGAALFLVLWKHTVQLLFYK